MTKQKVQSSKSRERLTAKNADKQALYQASVQDAASEVEFLDKIFKKRRDRRARSLREDFCGTALVCAEWLKSREERTATGVDLDSSVLKWGVKHNLKSLGEPGDRISLLNQDVRETTTEKFDLINAFNFSYWVFKSRSEMCDYFRAVRASLVDDGVFFLDAYGGWESVEPMLESRKIDGGFTYVWDQHRIDPITHDITNYIHFEFRDGSKLEKAFRYDWRFWSLPELKELLIEAGFSSVAVYWDVSEDEDRQRYVPKKRAHNQPGWLAYLVAER